MSDNQEWMDNVGEGIPGYVTPKVAIGAVVGGCYYANKLDEIEKWALTLNRFKVFSYLDFRVRSAGLVGGRKLRDTLDQHFKGMTFEDLPHPLVCIATDLGTGHEVWMSKGTLMDAMIASFSLRYPSGARQAIQPFCTLHVMPRVTSLLNFRTTSVERPVSTDRRMELSS